MPDDLLEFVSGPPSYSTVWLWLGLGLLLAVLLWYATVFVATMPSRSLAAAPGLRNLHGQLLRYRYAKTADDVTRSFRDGDLTAAQAGAELSHTLRSFLHQATGAPAQYMQLRTLANGDLASAAPVLETLGSAQFDRSSTVDVGRLGDQTAELIRSWS